MIFLFEGHIPYNIGKAYQLKQRGFNQKQIGDKLHR